MFGEETKERLRLWFNEQIDNFPGNQKAFAAALDVGEPTVTAYKKGDRGIGIDFLLRVTTKLNVPFPPFAVGELPEGLRELYNIAHEWKIENDPNILRTILNLVRLALDEHRKQPNGSGAHIYLNLLKDIFPQK
jgi:transcriptional regulator with XRE-family HTH domain